MIRLDRCKLSATSPIAACGRRHGAGSTSKDFVFAFAPSPPPLSRKGRGEKRRAFTLVEVMVASALTLVLALILSACWVSLGRPLAGMIGRGRLVEEIDLANTSLARDLGGYLANDAGRLGDKTQGPLIGWMQPLPNQLWLCFDGGPQPNGVAHWGPPDTVIIYRLDGDQLVRYDQTANTTFTVARV